jgi:hypothetical protein
MGLVISDIDFFTLLNRQLAANARDIEWHNICPDAS